MDALSDLFKGGDAASCGPHGKQFGVSGRLLGPNLLQQQRPRQQQQYAQQQWAAEMQSNMHLGGAMPGPHHHAARFAAANAGGGMAHAGAHASVAAGGGGAAKVFDASARGHGPVPMGDAGLLQQQPEQLEHMHRVAQQQMHMQAQRQAWLLQQQMLQHHQQQYNLQQPQQQLHHQAEEETAAADAAAQTRPVASSPEAFWKAASGAAAAEASGWSRTVQQAILRQQAGEQARQQREGEAGDASDAGQADTALASGEVSRILEGSEDDRVRNSQFLKFMRGLNVGALEIRGNTVVEKAPLPAGDHRAMLGHDTPYGPIADAAARSAAGAAAAATAAAAAEQQAPLRGFSGDADAAASSRPQQQAAAWHADPGPHVQGDADLRAAMQRAWEDPVGPTAGPGAGVSAAPARQQHLGGAGGMAAAMTAAQSSVNAQAQAQQHVLLMQQQQQQQQQQQPSQQQEQPLQVDSAEQQQDPRHGNGQPSAPKSAAVMRATELYEAGHIEAAVEFCRTCLDRSNPASLVGEGERAETLVVLGQCYAELNEDRLAIAAFETALQLDPYVDKACLKASACYINDGRVGDAAEVLNLWLRQDPRFMGIEYEPDAYSDGSPADEPLQKLLAANAEGAGDESTLREVREAIGVLCSAVGDPAQALTFFAQVLPVAGTQQHIILNQMAACQTRLGRHDAAVDSYRQALRLRPEYLRAWVNLGITHSNRGDFEASARCYLRAAELNESFLTMDGQELRPGGQHTRQEHDSAQAEDLRANEDEHLRAQLWSYLRITFAMMGRSDLVARSQQMQTEDFADFLDGALPGPAADRGGGGGSGGGGGDAKQ